MSLWETRILTFVEACSVGGFGAANEAILALADILDEAPEEVAPIISPRASRERLTQLIEVDAQIGSSSGLVKIVDEVEEGNFFAADPAVALLGAYGRALVSVMTSGTIPSDVDS